MNQLSASADPYMPGDQSQSLLETISQWQNTTTIILHGGSVFEFKGVFPKGELAHGFYNLKNKQEMNILQNLTEGTIFLLQLVTNFLTDGFLVQYLYMLQETQLLYQLPNIL